MSRFGTSIYGTDKWGTSEPNVNLIWGFEINWTGDSPDFDGSNEAPRLLSFRTERGRDHVFTADNKAFEPYQVGEASFVVDNRDGRYNPYNTTSELYGNCVAGKFVRFGVNKVDPLFSENVRNYIFSGIIDSIPLDTESKTATINVKDGWQYLQDHTPSSELRVRNSVFDIATMIIESISWHGLMLLIPF